MERIKLDCGWSYKRQAPSAMSVMMPGDETVNLPHDAEIGTEVNPNSPNGNSTGWYDGCFASYDKKYFFPKEWEGKRVFLQLDGSFWCTEVSLNGHLMGFHPSGYSPFSVELTDKINFGEENRINIFANNSQQRTGRWYSGTGVYRHVYLRVGEPVHLSISPTQIITEKTEYGRAYLKVKTGIENQSTENARLTVRVTLFEDKGRNAPLGKEAAKIQVDCAAAAGKYSEVKTALTLDEPLLWDTEVPNLYVVKTELLNDEKVIDSDSTLCGIRTVEITRENSLKLNGMPLKLKGGCIHSDNGILGAVSLYDAEYRKVTLHKEAGYNSFRCAHNPPSEDFLEACDRAGMLVLDELFDVWRMLKDPNDYHIFFDSCWKTDAYNSVMRDRIHPCVFMYSVGNEVGERNGLGGGYELAAEIADFVRKTDDSRPLNLSLPTTFNGLDDKDTALMLQSLYQKLQGGERIQNLTTEYSEKIFNEKTAPFASVVDTVGYNYIENRYEEDMKTFPERIFIQTESYPRMSGIIWDFAEKYPCILGDFTWTSMDYIGEAALGITVYSEPEEKKNYSRLNPPPAGYPNRTANCGDFDVIGEKRNQLMYRQCVWGSSETFVETVHPKRYGKDVYMSPYGWEDAYESWTFHGYEGKPTKVNVYSAADEVELFVNGVCSGRRACGKGADFTAVFDVEYQPGKITAVSYKNKKEISRKTYKTAGSPFGITAESDKDTLFADGESLAYIKAYIVDENGERLYLNDNKFTAETEGEIILAGFGSGNPVTDENYTKGEFTSYKGAILAVIRSGDKEGKGKLTISCEYGKAVTEFTIKNQGGHHDN